MGPGAHRVPPAEPAQRVLHALPQHLLPAQPPVQQSVNVPPFLINYSGALFREYPGPWQVMLRQDDGSLVCVAEDDVRFTLGEAKYELMEAMGLRTEEKGSTMEFFGGATSREPGGKRLQ